MMEQGLWEYDQVDAEEREQLKTWLRGLLQERVVTVEFVKADGSPRRMECTLAESAGAKYSTNESTRKKPHPDTCVVWDTNQNAWRSFRWDRLKRITFNLG